MERLDSVALWRCMCAMHRRRWVSTVASITNQACTMWGESAVSSPWEEGPEAVVPVWCPMWYC